MNHFDTKDLEIIAAISSCTSLEAVAAKVGINTSNVSKRLTAMKKHYGNLPIAVYTPLQLTAHGYHILKFAQAIEQAHATLVTDIERAATTHKMLRIMSSQSMLIDDVLPVLKLVRGKFEQLKIHLVEGDSAETVKTVAEGQADIGLVSCGGENTRGLIFNVYRTAKIVLLAHKDHPIKAHKSISIADAAQFPFVGVDSPVGLTRKMSEEQLQVCRNMQIQLSGQSLEVCAQLAATTPMGLCMTMERVAERQARLHKAAIIELSDTFASIDFATVTRGDTDAWSPEVTEFIRFLRKANQ